MSDLTALDAALLRIAQLEATIMRIGLLVEEGVVNPKPPNVAWVKVSKLKNALKERKDWRSK